jgi:hypothetical protein
MKRLIAVCVGVVALTGAAQADPYDGSGVYSKATPNCVPAVQALLWYDVGFRLLTSRLRDRLELDLKNATPACWLGKASAAVGVKHRKLYLPSESRKIRRWFERQGASF